MLSALLGVSETRAGLAGWGDRCCLSLEGESGGQTWETSLGRMVAEASLIKIQLTLVPLLMLLPDDDGFGRINIVTL